jgi:hypothetical protein
LGSIISDEQFFECPSIARLLEELPPEVGDLPFAALPEAGSSIEVAAREGGPLRVDGNNLAAMDADSRALVIEMRYVMCDVDVAPATLSKRQSWIGSRHRGFLTLRTAITDFW